MTLLHISCCSFWASYKECCARNMGSQIKDQPCWSSYQHFHWWVDSKGNVSCLYFHNNGFRFILLWAVHDCKFYVQRHDNLFSYIPPSTDSMDSVVNGRMWNSLQPVNSLQLLRVHENLRLISSAFSVLILMIHCFKTFLFFSYLKHACLQFLYGIFLLRHGNIML